MNPWPRVPENVDPMVFDFRGNSRHTEVGFLLRCRPQTVFEFTLYRNGMFGKRGETPPLPRNCEARTFDGR